MKCDILRLCSLEIINCSEFHRKLPNYAILQLWTFHIINCGAYQPRSAKWLVFIHSNQCQIKIITKIEFALSSLPKFKSIARPSLRTWTIVSATNIWFNLFYECFCILFHLALAHNPLSPEISKIYQDLNGDKKLLNYLRDHLAINTLPPPERSWITVRNIDPDFG